MALDETFVSELRRALAHLHDPAYLENHPLAARLSGVSESPGLSSGQLLSRVLRLSIEALDPGPGVVPTAPEARPYHVLRSHYISQHGVPRIGEQLGISERQTYRELRRGLEALAHILEGYEAGGNQESASSVEQIPSPATKVYAEVARLSRAGHQVVDIVQVVDQAVGTARHLAQDWGVQIEWSAGMVALYATLNRVMLRQVIINLLSHAVHRHCGGSLDVRLHRSGTDALLLITYNCGARAISPRPGQPCAVAAELLGSLGVNWSHEEQDNGTARITVRIPLAQQHKVLIVDDNVGLIRLFERYLDGQPYAVYSATSAAKALEALRNIRPDVVILDVMIPERDGWEVLQALRQSEAGPTLRVLVCSIINDPDLAKSLGADGFLHKPVDRASLLHALEELFSSTA